MDVSMKRWRVNVRDGRLACTERGRYRANGLGLLNYGVFGLLSCTNCCQCVLVCVCVCVCVCIAIYFPSTYPLCVFKPITGLFSPLGWS